MRRVSRLIVTMFIVAAVPHAVSAAVVIKTSDGNGADAYAQGTSGNTAPFPNTGSETSLILKNGGAADQFARKTYLRFDLAALGSTPFHTATLDLTISNNNGSSPTTFTVQVFGLLDGFAGVDNSGPADGDVVDEEDVHDEFWAESTLDWDSAPANVTTSGFSLDASATLLGSFNITASDVTGSVVSFSSAALASFIKADTNGVITLILRRSGTHAGGSENLSFFSKETVAAIGDPSEPTLTLVPEPAALGLLVMGLPMLMRRG